jgi:hypothetical protein
MANAKFIFTIALIAAYPFALLFTRHMEATHRFDSIGLWYTIYVSAFFAIIAAAVVVLLSFAFARFRAGRVRATRR